jgi:hypothetical protein
LSWDIVDAMSTVKELTLSPAGTVAEPPVAGDEEDDVAGEDDDDEVVDDDEFDEQAAAIRATPAARATHPSRGRGRLNVPWPCERESPPP